MFDKTYCYKNTNTLKNKYKIRDKEKLEELESQSVAVKLFMLKVDPKHINTRDNITHIKELHEFLFKDLYTWAGKYRTIDFYKEERVLGGASVQYVSANQIHNNLKKALDKADKVNWNDKNFDNIVDNTVTTLKEIWEVHPFREGNTRTTLTFMQRYLESKNIALDTNLLKENSGYFRDSLVMATYDRPEYLKKILKDSLSKNKDITHKKGVPQKLISAKEKSFKYISKKNKEKASRER